jgi:glutamate dehydrogenase
MRSQRGFEGWSKRMDYIGVKKLAPDGTVRGEHRFIGLFTSRVYAADAEHVPILRRKLDQILSAAGRQRRSGPTSRPS